MIGQLRLGVEVVKNSVNNTITFIQTEFKKAGTTIEKFFGESASKGIKNLKKESENTLNTIAKLNDKIGNLKRDLDTEIIGGKRFKELQKEIGKTEKALEKATGGSKSFFSSLGGIGGALGGIIALSQAKDTADIFSSMQNSLKLVSEGKELDILQKKILDTANNARVPVDALTKSFVRFDLVNKQLGGTQDETLKIMDSLSKGLSMTGASAEETSSTMLQLSQAFGSGVLMGDEFRAVSESMPMLLDILAKKLGVPRGELKNLASEGKITSQVLKEALIEANEQITESFNNSQVSIGQKLTQIRNDFIVKFGEIDKNVGFTDKIVKSLEFIRNTFLSFFQEFPNISLWIGGALLGLTTLSATILVLGPAVTGLFGLFGFLTTAISGTTLGVVGLRTALTFLTGPVGLVIAGLTALVGVGYAYREELGFVSQKVDEVSKITGVLTNKLNDNLKAQQDLDKMYSDGKISLQDYNKEIKDLKIEQENLNLAMKQAGGVAYDYKTAIDELASTYYAPDTEGYIKERDEIIKNIEASIDLLKAKRELGVTTLDDIRKQQKQLQETNIGQPLSGIGSTSELSGLSSQITERLEQQSKITHEIAKRQEEINKIDESIAKIRDGVDYKGDYGKTSSGGSSGKSPKEKTPEQIAKEEQELALSRLETEKRLAIWKASIATGSEEEKAKKILEINEKYDKKLNDLKGDTFKNEVDKAKETLDNIKKKRQENLDNAKKIYTDMSNNVDKYISKAKDNIKDFDTAIENSQKKIKDLNNDLKALGEDKASTLGDRFVEIGDKTKELNDELKKLKNDGINQGLAESIGIDTLKVLGTGDIGGNKVEDLIKILEIQKELNDLKNEESLIKQNVDSGVLSEAQRIANLSPTAKYLEEYEAKIKSIEDEKVLEEQRLINLETSKQNEVILLENFTKAKENLEDRFKKYSEDIEAKITGVVESENQKRLDSLTNYVNNGLSQLQRLAEMKSNIGGDYLNTNLENSQFAEGGYTGPGGKYEVAGVVHKGEYVVPQHVLRNIPDLAPALEKVRLGGYTGANQTFNNQKSISVGGITVQNKVDLESFFDKLRWKL